MRGQLEQARQRRQYDSSLRRERAAQTRERILGAGLQLAHECPVWDWRALTIRAAAERAGVSERTVYRHFPGEREFHDAVMQRLEEQAGSPLRACGSRMSPTPPRGYSRTCRRSRWCPGRRRTPR